MLLVLGPGVDGPFYGDGGYVREAGAAHHGGDVGDCVERELGFGGRVVHVRVPSDEGGVCRQGAVVAFYYEVDVVDFEVAAIFEVAGEFVNTGYIRTGGKESGEVERERQSGRDIGRPTQRLVGTA